MKEEKKSIEGIDYPKGSILFEKGTCNMCGGELPKDAAYCQTLCQSCKDDPNVVTGEEMITELEKDPLLTPMKPSPYI